MAKEHLKSFVKRIVTEARSLIFKINSLFAKENSQITFLINFDYQAEYVADLVKNKTKFVFRKSRFRCDNKDESISKFAWSDHQTQNVVLMDETNFFREGFTAHHRLILRMQHSPGFGIWVPLYLYERMKQHRGKLMIASYVWELAQNDVALDEKTKRIRDLILNDGTPILFTNYDLKINNIFRFSKKYERKPGTLVIALNWRIRRSIEDIKLLEKAISFLRNDFKIRVLFHPLITDNDFRNGENLHRFKSNLESLDIKSSTQITSLEELVKIYDENEFILTDGSGSAYEAIIRGCKALSLTGLSYQEKGGVLYPTLKLNLLPQNPVWDYKNYSDEKADLDLVKTFFSPSLTKESVLPLVSQEIESAFANWT